MKNLSSEKEATRNTLIADLYRRVDYYANNNSNTNFLSENEQIEEVVIQLVELEKELAFDLPNRDGNWEPFKAWCAQNGVAASQMDKVDIKKVQQNSSEYGLFSKADFKENDVLLEIPRKLFMSNETAMADGKLGAFYQDAIFKHIPNLMLTFHLISEINKSNSFWAPYLNILPKSYSTVLYLNQDELKQLTGSPMLEEAVKIKRNFARQYVFFWNKLENDRQLKRLFPNFTYDLFRWALSTVLTRLNSIPSKADPNNSIFALIPLWDLCNHKEGKMSTDFDVKKDCLVFYSNSNVKSGSEIYNYYGNRSNADFFLHNGFVYDAHPNNSVKVKIGISKADPMFILKDSLCKKASLATYGSYDIENRSKPLNSRILAIVRIFLMSKEELQKWIMATNWVDLFEEDCPELNHLNQKVKEFLSMRCSLLLKKYPKVDNFINPNIKKIVNLEKQVLQSFVV